MSSLALSDEQVRNLLRAFTEGTKLTIKYFNRGDPQTIQKANGEIFASGEDSWILQRSSSSYNRFPNPDLAVTEIALYEAPRRSRSRPHDESDASTPIIVDDSIAGMCVQLPRPQPVAEPARTPVQITPPSTQRSGEMTNSELMRFVFEAMSKQQSEHSAQIAALTQAVLRQNEDRASVPHAQPQPAARATVGSDVQSIMQLSDAIKGQDNPTWRLAPGLILMRFIPNRFKIFSIPHLLFKEDPVTFEMVKVPCGQAVALYESLLAKYKLTFPNMIATTSAHRGSKTEPTGAMSFEGSQGVFAQLDRAERIFNDLLLRLDQLNSATLLPSAKDEWRVFLDAGVGVLELYATLSKGFMKGGAKVAMAHNIAMETTGRFDPPTLWPKDDDKSAFRTTH
jgi:hypothetical protein